MDADWTPGAVDPLEARATTGNIVYITPADGFTPEICGVRVAQGVSVLAEVTGDGVRDKTLPDGSTVRVCDLLTFGGPLDAD